MQTLIYFKTYFRRTIWYELWRFRKNAIDLCKGLAKAGTWMNTGEGGLSEYHLKGNGDIISELVPVYLVLVIKKVILVKVYLKRLHSYLTYAHLRELKLAQGAKTSWWSYGS
ncbi:glutamate synthase-related protein [Staphylococcus aureus]